MRVDLNASFDALLGKIFEVILVVFFLHLQLQFSKIATYQISKKKNKVQPKHKLVILMKYQIIKSK